VFFFFSDFLFFWDLRYLQESLLTREQNTLSGTSFSAAHAAGLGAYLLGLKPNLSPEELGDYIQSIATRDVVKGLQPGTKNLLAYNGIDL